METDIDLDKRVAIPVKLFDRLSAEVQKIKDRGSYFKVNEGKLVCAIVELFLDKYMEKKSKVLDKVFFDKRLYLKSLIADANSDEELSASIDSYLKVSKAGRSQRARIDGK